MKSIRFIEATLPEFGLPDILPVLPDALYAERYARLADRVQKAGLDALVLCADRERSASVSYLTGWDPRFEDAVFVHVPGRAPTVITGPENLEFAKAGGLKPETMLYPPFGVLGSDRSATPPLMEIFADLGIARGMTVGIVGAKYFSILEAAEPQTWIDAPAFIVDTLRRLVGVAGHLVNVTDLLAHPTEGLRAVNEIDQLARFEFAAAHSSQAIREVIFAIMPGMREFEAVRLMRQTGLPLSCHPMFASGPRARFGLNSPSDRKIERGDPLCFGYGLWGGFNNRAGWLIEDEGELPSGAEKYSETIAMPFFTAVARWYETIDIGVAGGELDAQVRSSLATAGLSLALNPGHLIHNEEWLNTPIYPGSAECLRSGQAVQCDILPSTADGVFTSAMEDGILLLDEASRFAFAERYPGAWDRIGARRTFMEETLGIRLKQSVLPTSNIPAYLPPFLLNPQRILSCTRN